MPSFCYKAVNKLLHQVPYFATQWMCALDDQADTQESGVPLHKT